MWSVKRDQRVKCLSSLRLDALFRLANHINRKLYTRYAHENQWDPRNLWRSISAKIQCYILHCTLHNLSYILCLSFAVTLAIQLFRIQHSSFRSRHSTFHKQQSSFLIRLWALYLQVSAFDTQLFELNFYRLVSERWRSWAQLTWLTPAQMVVESRSRDFPVEWLGRPFPLPTNQTSTDVFSTMW